MTPEQSARDKAGDVWETLPEHIKHLLIEQERQIMNHEKLSIKRSRKSYSSITRTEAESIINQQFNRIYNTQTPVDNIIKYKNEHTGIKEDIYINLVRCINVEDFPVSSLDYIKEATITDMVSIILIPIIAEFQEKENKKDIRLRREKDIPGLNETKGIEDYVILDTIEENKEIYLLIIEAKRSNTDEGLIQCVLAMHDAYTLNNDNKPIYGFVTTGARWRLVKYGNDKSIKISEEFNAAFATMEKDKQRWLNECSKIVDIIYSTLFH